MAPLVAVVDDDLSVRESLESLIRSVGLDVRLSASAEEFLNSPQSRKADCLVFDVRLPGMSGIDLHRHLVAQRCKCRSSSSQHMDSTTVRSRKLPRIGRLLT